MAFVPTRLRRWSPAKAGTPGAMSDYFFKLYTLVLLKIDIGADLVHHGLIS